MRTLFVLFGLGSLVACGGGGSSGPAPTPTPTPTPPSALGQLFAPLAAADAASTSFKYLKACYFPTRQAGAVGQAGVEFLESLVIDTLPASTAVLYNAQNGNSVRTTTRTYRGSSPAVGAPPLLWTGVMRLNTDGSASGFGVPCTPNAMTERPTDACYWLGKNETGTEQAIGQFISLGATTPETSSTGTSLINPGWGTGTAYYFWYEFSFGASCSAPNSTTLWRGPARAGS
jgi:hypothetical protein